MVLTERRRASRWFRRCRRRCWASVSCFQTTHVLVSRIYVVQSGCRAGGSQSYQTPTGWAFTDTRNKKSSIMLKKETIDCEVIQILFVKLCTCAVKRAVAVIPIQLCKEYMLGMWLTLWKSNTAQIPTTDRTNARSITAACASFQGSLLWPQVRGMRYSTAPAGGGKNRKDA